MLHIQYMYMYFSIQLTLIIDVDVHVLILFHKSVILYFPSHLSRLQRELITLTQYAWNSLLGFVNCLRECVSKHPGLITENDQILLKIKVQCTLYI